MREEQNLPREERKDTKKKKYPTRPAKRFNDPNWYKTKDGQLALSVGNLSYANVLGNALPLAKDGSTTQSMPGLCLFNYIPHFGISRDGTSALNIATRAIYSFIRHKNSGSKVYEQSDYAMYWLSVDAAFEALSELLRVYGLLNSYYHDNRFYAKAIIEELGWDYSSLVGNASDFLARINTLIYKLGSLSIPKGFPVYDRHILLGGNLFTDSKVPKHQTYAFRSVKTWKFTATKYESGSALECVDTPWRSKGAATYTEACDFVNNLLDELLTNEDIGIMSGDTFKAFGESGCYKMSEAHPDYTTAKIHDDYILAQIHHIVCTNMPYDNLDIIQENNNIIYNPGFSANPSDPHVSMLSNYILDYGLGSENAPVDYNLEATRLMPVFTAATSLRNEIASCGTEFITGIAIIGMANGNSFELGYCADSKFLSNALSQNNITFLMAASKIDWMPILYLYNGETSVMDFQGNVFNFTVLSTNELIKMHDACLIGLFDYNKVTRNGLK